jgi:hypothetical protein
MKLSATAVALPVAPTAVLLSVLFSVLTILQNPLLNDDAYSYLRAAETFATSGALAVLETYGWYSYSILIALLDRVLPGNLVVAAHLFNTACYALLVFVFIQLAGEIRNTRRMRWFAALTILGFPLLNEMRYFLIRDTAFWAFTLLSLLYFIRFSRNGQTRNAVCWCLALFSAIAFRLEGLLLLLAPLGMLLPEAGQSTRERLQRCGRLLGIMVAALVGLLLLTLLFEISLLDLISYAYRYYLPRLANLFTLLAGTANDVSAALFTPENFPGSDNTALGLVILLFAYALALLTNLVYALSLPLVVVLLVYAGLRRPLALPAHCRRALYTYIGASLLALLLFLLIMHFMTQRYTTLLCLLLLTLLPRILDDLYERAVAHDTVARFRAVLLLFSLYYLVDSLISFGYSHQHVLDGIAWTRSNLPADARLQTNNYAIARGSRRIPDYDKVSTSATEVALNSTSGDYVVLDLGHDDLATLAALEADTQLRLVTSFANERGDAVRIYRRL